MLEYRIDRARCVHRMWDVGNETASSEDIYMVEPLLHEALLQSPHRTLDPDEADFFYVPLYTTCFIYPVFGWADYPWFYGPGSFRVNQAAMMALEAKRWLETHLPYWNRRGGRDHVWLFAHDEGSCWVPQEIWEASIILSSWGRTDEHPKSGTSFWMDNYSYPAITRWNPDGFTDVIGDHPCFDPKVDPLPLPILLFAIFYPPAPFFSSFFPFFFPFFLFLFFFFFAGKGKEKKKKKKKKRAFMGMGSWDPQPLSLDQAVHQINAIRISESPIKFTGKR
eukprot:jgi/Botrbrau1/20037/Bobra.200_1s0042.1